MFDSQKGRSNQVVLCLIVNCVWVCVSASMFVLVARV